MELYALLVTVGLVVALIRWGNALGERTRLRNKLHELQSDLESARYAEEQARTENARLRPFAVVQDATAEAERIRDAARSQMTQVLEEAREEAKRLRLEATTERATARAEAERLKATSTRDAQGRLDSANAAIANAGIQAAKIIEDAKKHAESIAGDAYRALKEADRLSASAQAMRNVIEGYGDRYMVPTHSLLDDLAEAYSHTEAGKELKLARERTRYMVTQDRAATCGYVERARRETAVRFVVDAFNGKSDSILSRVRVDNFGTLQQEIRDAAALVNENGAAFRDAKVLPEYVDARIEELKWAVRANELREREREEQRRIRDQLREEERARREFERAMREAAREEELVRKALEKAQAQLEKASTEQRQKFEEMIQQLQGRLTEAEQKNQRALSMAQQTKAGHVYIISNVGSFGDEVFKIGMTRRLEPLDRIRELGDASVPFSFDVHALIWSENAPAMETALHRQFLQSQVNKVNPRKEFFRVGVKELREAMEARGIQASWTMAAEAREYRESQVIEQRIREDGAAREAWVRQQLIYEATAPIDEEVEDALATSPVTAQATEPTA